MYNQSDIDIPYLVSKTAGIPDGRNGSAVSAGPDAGDEDWQLSKDSADAATAMRCAVREKIKSGIETVTELLPAPVQKISVKE